MARERSRYQKGRVVSTEAGGWEIHYNVYVTDPSTGKPKRRHRSRQGLIFKVMNTAWRGQFHAKKVKRKNRFGGTNCRLVAIPEAV